ncbi:unnamed protein product [Sphagnum jensenii]|uniref:Cyclin-like domain-containing protein n=1 Tax=Sphagnum jensenii TaxID=128206 RepID=A0ABP1BGD9_9BRYO
MAQMMQGGDAQLALAAAGPNSMNGKLEEPDHSSANWYFSREEIEKNSPSRKDGIDLKKETYFRKSYCTFLQDLGMRLKVPQVTIATAILFCHRFFLRQSHHRNDRYMVATICMFIAGKVEETPRSLRDVILVSYENRFKKDPAAVHRIKQKEVYEAEKEKVLLGERLVLTTLGFDLNIHHPYKPLVAAIKKFQVAANTLAQVAWNFVNDGLRTSLCLQFKPHHIAAGAIFLAAKFLKVKLPSDGDKVWWQEFGVTPRQLEEVSNQMLELYEQNKSGTGSRLSDPTSSAGLNNQLRGLAPAQAMTDVPPANGHCPLPATVKTQSEEVKAISTFVDVHAAQGEFTEAQSSLEEGEDMAESKVGLVEMKSTDVTVQTLVSVTKVEPGERRTTEAKMESVDDSKPAWGSLEEVNTDKVKAAMEKRRRSRGGTINAHPTFDKVEPSNEEELLERELESGVEAAVHAQSDHAGRREQTVKVVHRVEHETADVKRKRADAGEAAAAAKRTRGVTGVEGHSSDRKVKSQGHGERPYIEAVTTKGSSGPVEDGELPSSNQDLGILFSPARLEKRAHASLVGRERVTSSPGNQRGHYQSTGDQNREGHRDSRHAVHARDQLHHHHASSNSAHRHSQQQRPDVDSDRRSYAHREQVDPDHRKGRHEHGN